MKASQVQFAGEATEWSLAQTVICQAREATEAHGHANPGGLEGVSWGEIWGDSHKTEQGLDSLTGWIVEKGQGGTARVGSKLGLCSRSAYV